ncbi:hypothetical protein ACE38W_18040 [Chitinophaga sp. Hz27]|uniref:hypothetical protein n=1 Tax=Chitinophaga sp. Hz27 TaxID=3347169 RepID=UPI0035DF1362
MKQAFLTVLVCLISLSTAHAQKQKKYKKLTGIDEVMAIAKWETAHIRRSSPVPSPTTPAEWEEKYGNYTFSEEVLKHMYTQTETLQGDPVVKNRFERDFRSQMDKEMFYHEEVYEDMMDIHYALDSTSRYLNSYSNEAPVWKLDTISQRLEVFKSHYPKVNVSNLEKEIAFFKAHPKTRDQLKAEENAENARKDSIKNAEWRVEVAKSRNTLENLRIEDSINGVKWYGNYKEYRFQQDLRKESKHGDLVVFGNMNFNWMGMIHNYLQRQEWEITSESKTANSKTYLMNGPCALCVDRKPWIRITCTYNPATKKTISLTITGSAGVLDNIFVGYWERTDIWLLSRWDYTYYYTFTSDKISYVRKPQGGVIKVVKDPNLEVDLDSFTKWKEKHPYGN